MIHYVDTGERLVPATQLLRELENSVVFARQFHAPLIVMRGRVIQTPEQVWPDDQRTGNTVQVRLPRRFQPTT